MKQLRKAEAKRVAELPYIDVKLLMNEAKNCERKQHEQRSEQSIPKPRLVPIALWAR